MKLSPREITAGSLARAGTASSARDAWGRQAACPGTRRPPPSSTPAPTACAFALPSLVLLSHRDHAALGFEEHHVESPRYFAEGRTCVAYAHGDSSRAQGVPVRPRGRP